MKVNKSLMGLVCAAIFFSISGCTKDNEPLGGECDILSMTLHLDEPLSVLFDAADTLQTLTSSQTSISVLVRPEADVTALAPRFEITSGATISPASGSVQDFTSPVTYTVTAEDGVHSRRYTVAFHKQEVQQTSDTVCFDFEHYKIDDILGQYYTWYELSDGGDTLDWWATANVAFLLTGMGSTPDDFPTVADDNGYQGACVRLVTRSTGPLGAWSGKYIAPGSLYIGTFSTDDVVSNPLSATRFGMPFARKPLTLQGYYKYTPGETFVDSDNNPVDGRVDEGSIYAVLYRNKVDDESVVLTGEDVMTNPNIVAIAKYDVSQASAEWARFEVPFNYSGDIVDSLLSNNGYSLTVVFSSSSRGDYFEGAVGSTLMVDNIRLICGSSSR